MQTKVILLVLMLMLTSACLCVATPEPTEVLLEKYGTAQLILGFLIVGVCLGSPLWVTLVLFKKII